MFVAVRAKKRQQTLECRPSSLLSAAQLNKDLRLCSRITKDSGTRDEILQEFHLSVVQEKTCFNSSKGSRIQSLAPTVIDTHNSTLRRTHLEIMCQVIKEANHRDAERRLGDLLFFLACRCGTPIPPPPEGRGLLGEEG